MNWQQSYELSKAHQADMIRDAKLNALKKLSKQKGK